MKDIIIFNSDKDKSIPKELENELGKCTYFEIVMPFIRWNQGMEILSKHLKGKKGLVVTTTDQFVTDPESLK
jgi:HKD family nuclease